eukprot:Seg5051.2 transcript_id=Seg5051.2/GoldUCD/mRNA.D3Y31 product="hypothetical protein" protein_id=Seg5051.2/GoldUCD/D3Y31
MGRFSKSCSNVLHAEWCEDEAKNCGSVRVPKYKHLQAFKKMATEKGLKPHKIKFVCNTCIETAGLKRDFIKYLPDSKESTGVENKVFAPVTSFSHSPFTCI